MQHKEAFCLMIYQCRDCNAMEVIWNSRDGVTPFGCNCRQCGSINNLHAHWNLDVYYPKFKLPKGMRYFDDATMDDAIQYAERKLKLIQDKNEELKQTIVDDLKNSLIEEYLKSPKLCLA